MRIYKDKLYIEEIIPGISGYQRWNEREYYLIDGKTAQCGYRKINVISEYIRGKHQGKFKLRDGHLSNFCPVTQDEKTAINFLLTTTQSVELIDFKKGSEDEIHKKSI